MPIFSKLDVNSIALGFVAGVAVMMVAGKAVRIAIAIAIALAVAYFVFTLQGAKASAAQIRSDDETGLVVVGKETVIDDNLIVSGSTVDIKGKINGDLIVFGSNVTIDGTIDGDLLVAGSNVSISGTINRNTVAISSSLIYSANTARDLAISASSVSFLTGSSTGGTLYLGATSVSGKDSISIGKETKIINFRSRSDQNILYGYIVSIMALITTGIVMIKLFPESLDKIDKTLATRWGMSALTGVITMIVVPFTAIILIGSRIGLPIGLTLLGIWLFSFYLAIIVASRRVGELLLVGRLNNEYARFVAGSIVLGAILFLTPIGSIVTLVSIILGLGAITIIIKNTLPQTAGKHQ